MTGGDFFKIKKWESSPDRILFLDIDGVLNSIRRATGLGQKAFSASGFDPISVSLMRQLVHRTEAQIVISSSWGKSIGKTPEWWIGLFAGYGWEYPQADVIGITPTCQGIRGNEIREWIRLYDIERGGLGADFKYVIIDDDPDFHDDQPLVLTDTRQGLTLDEVDRAVDLLGERHKLIFEEDSIKCIERIQIDKDWENNQLP